MPEGSIEERYKDPWGKGETSKGSIEERYKDPWRKEETSKGSIEERYMDPWRKVEMPEGSIEERYKDPWGKEETSKGSIEERYKDPWRKEEMPEGSIEERYKDPWRKEETSKGTVEEACSQRSPSKSNKLQSPSSEQKEEIKDELRKKKPAGEPTSPPGYKNCSTKTSEPSGTCDTSKDYAKKKREELMQMISRRQRQIHIRIKTQSKVFQGPSSSTLAKHTTSDSSSDVAKDVSSGTGTFKSGSYQKPDSSTAQQVSFSVPPLPQHYKIPKKVQPRPQEVQPRPQGVPPRPEGVPPRPQEVPPRPQGVPPRPQGVPPRLQWVRRPLEEPSNEKNNVLPDDTLVRNETLYSVKWTSRTEPGTDPPANACLLSIPGSSFGGQEIGPFSLLSQDPASLQAVPQPWVDQMQVVEELSLARSESRLDVMQSYGELTCMEIDPPEEGGADSRCNEQKQLDLIIVLDTNVLISHLEYVKRIRSHGLTVLGLPVVLIPWVVLQELDSLKRRSGLPRSVAHLASPAIAYIHRCLKTREPRLWGQSMQQAAENDLNAENNDDRVLQCCLQYQSLYPEVALILCTNDKNLCSKALLSGVTALSKNDLEEEVGRSITGFTALQNQRTFLPQASPHAASPTLDRSFTPGQERAEDPAELVEKDLQQKSEDGTRLLFQCVSELEDCLRDVLSHILEVEMKNAYDHLWLEIVYVKPPWTLLDVLRCFRKHWIAVFGHVVPRWMQNTVSDLIDFFSSGTKGNLPAFTAAFQEAKRLVEAFGKRSKRVPGAVSQMVDIFNKLQPQGESPEDDVDMKDDEEDDEEEQQPSCAHVSNQEVWALFEKIWLNVYQLSMQVFKAVGFDPYTSSGPVGGPPPPQDALLCLHNLSSVAAQLLQAFSSVLSSAPGSEEVHFLLSIIHNNKIVDVDSRMTAEHVRVCFSQQEYREKLRVGGNQLLRLKEALDACGRGLTSTS